MPHPHGGRGNTFDTHHSFAEGYQYVGPRGVDFQSTTNETIWAKQGMARDGITRTIVFQGRTRHGNVCESCWGHRLNCSGTRMGQCVEGLDREIP